MKKEIERAILETLVIENKQSIRYAVDKIGSIFHEQLNTSTKELQKQLTGFVKKEVTAQYFLDALRSKMSTEASDELDCIILENRNINPNSWRLEIKIIKD